jgi:protein gp37
MREIWNPWHGCKKVSEGCENCYMYFEDASYGKRGSDIYKVKTAFNYPISKNRQHEYKVPSGTMLRTCITSDFFLKEADQWRDEAWDIMRQRPDLMFWITTKRVERVAECLPSDWTSSGWENIILNVSCENQRRTDERVPQLLELPFHHKGILTAPLLGPINLEQYLSSGQIEQISCSGESYANTRPCDFDWVKSLRQQCVDYNVTFGFFETGELFIKDGKTYHMPDRRIQIKMAQKSGMDFTGAVCTSGAGDEVTRSRIP